MRNIAYFLAGMVVMATISVADARRHYHHGHGCRLGQILVRHTGQCISRESAVRGGIIEPPRQAPPRRQQAYYVEVPVQKAPEPGPPPTPRCDTWMPDSTGWPGRWVRNEGLVSGGRWRF